MPTYTYTGEPERYYPTLGLHPEPGKSYELDRNPGDGRFDPPDQDPAAETPSAGPAATTASAAGVSSAAKKKGV